MVLTADLESMLDTLNAVYSQHYAQDLVEQYRKLDNRNRRSPMTIAIDNQRKKIEAYISFADEQAAHDEETLVPE